MAERKLPPCEGCGKPQPVWPAGWRFTDDHVLCPTCKKKITPLHSAQDARPD